MEEGITFVIKPILMVRRSKWLTSEERQQTQSDPLRQVISHQLSAISSVSVAKAHTGLRTHEPALMLMWGPTIIGVVTNLAGVGQLNQYLKPNWQDQPIPIP